MKKYIRITLPEEYEWLGIISMKARSKIIFELLKGKSKEELLKLALSSNQEQASSGSNSNGFFEEVLNKNILNDWD